MNDTDLCKCGHPVSHHEAEEWREVPGWPGYEVSSWGRVKSWRRHGVVPPPRILTPTLNPAGYYFVGLYRDGKRKVWTVHRLVALCFQGPRPDGMETRHLDGNPLNNHPWNLKYGTSSENNRDRVKHGRDHNAVKTTCPQGHPYDTENTYVMPNGGRDCRACVNERGRRYRARKRAFQRDVK